MMQYIFVHMLTHIFSTIIISYFVYYSHIILTYLVLKYIPYSYYTWSIQKYILMYISLH
jgi:hypothetical protein